MAYDIENTVINDTLCYLSTSRNCLSRQVIITNVVGFYQDDVLKKAKELLFKICNEKLIQRKACTSHPNPIMADVDDMISLFEKAESKRMLLPRFVAEHYLSLPPGSGFESIALVLCSLREEVSDMRKEINAQRESNSRDEKSFEDMLTVKQDVADIKISLQNKSNVSNNTCLCSLSGNEPLSTGNNEDPTVVPRYSQVVKSKNVPLSNHADTNRPAGSSVRKRKDSFISENRRTADKQGDVETSQEFNPGSQGRNYQAQEGGSHALRGGF